jgi:lipoprotein-anchoring transpeptidase ErfK/SrfK
VRPQPPLGDLPERGMPLTPLDEPADRRRGRTLLLGALAALALLLVALVAAIWVTMPRLADPSPRGLVADSTPTLRVQLEGRGTLDADRVSVRIDGEPVAASSVRVDDAGRAVVVRLDEELADGDHQVQVDAASVGLLRRSLRERWTLTVDTVAPSARIVSPAATEQPSSAYVGAGVAAVTKLPMRLTVAAEPGSSIAVSSSLRDLDDVIAAPSEDSRRTIELALPEGAQVLTVRVADEAGNVTTRRLRVLVDTTGPAVQARIPRVLRSATLELPVVVRDPHGVDVAVSLNGTAREDVLADARTTAPEGIEAPVGDESMADAAPAADSGGDEPVMVSDESTSDEDPASGTDDADDANEPQAPLPVSLRATMTLDEPLLEGRNALEVLATDSLGNERIVTRTIIVDSGEELGDVAGLRPGARGRDVVQLHDALVKQEVVARRALARDARTRTYGAQTSSAVKRFQSSRGMSADGVAGADTIAALTLRIVVDRSSNTLTLYRVGDVVKTYRVATGAAEYPTPAGEFEIQTMQMNPTWTPPDSDWAEGAEPIPPGPDNPLGTRWMAIYGTVGIHGTNNPASLGYSVSHGCIRMAIPDVEELFEQVAIGTPVEVI